MKNVTIFVGTVLVALAYAVGIVFLHKEILNFPPVELETIPIYLCIGIIGSIIYDILRKGGKEFTN